MLPRLTGCLACRHYLGMPLGTPADVQGFEAVGGRCDAFARIPEDIWVGRVEHATAYPGDRGIHFEPVTAEHPGPNPR